MAFPPPPYKDAVVGTPVAGEAIVGTWWAYPPQPGLQLGGYQPEVTALASNVVPSAGLALVGWAPTVEIVQDASVVVTPAGLALKAITPTVAISTILAVAPAGLLLGGYEPDSIGQKFLFPIDCLDLVISAAPERVLVLAGAPEREVDLVPTQCL